VVYSSAIFFWLMPRRNDTSSDARLGQRRPLPHPRLSPNPRANRNSKPSRNPRRKRLRRNPH
jgi:hypothetical protein